MRIRAVLAALLVGIIGLSAGAVAPVFASDLPIFVNERKLLLPAPAVNQQGRLLVPFRDYIEWLGGTVHWDPSGQITAEVHGRGLSLFLGSPVAQVAGKPLAMDVPAQIIDGRTYIPLRAISEGLGALVDYDGTAVRITTRMAADLVVMDGPLNVRALPAVVGPVITIVPVGTRFDVLEVGPEWSQVLLSHGRIGWVATRYTTSAAPIPAVNPLAPVQEGGAVYLEVQGNCLGPVPLIENRTFVPLRAMMEPLHGQVAKSDGVAIVRYRGHELIFRAGEPTAQVNGHPMALGAAPVQLGQDLLVPARSLADWLGLMLHWDGSARTASVQSPDSRTAGLSDCHPPVPVRSYLVMDAATGLVLSEYKADERRLIASTTKLVTLLLALERGNLNSVVTASRKAALTDGSRMGLKTGDRFTLRDMLYGLMLPSGNDAAVAIAEHFAGTEAAFAKQMTQRAAELGAVNSDFHTASGLDDDSWPLSTARDLAIITQHALQNVDFRAITSTGSYRISGPMGTRVLYNRNDFIFGYKGATGVKNGWTPDAGHTLVASAYRDGRELIVVVLGAATRDQLYKQAYWLMDYGFGLYDQAWMLAAAR